MNMEDEDEYLDFYDFSKTYENHPLLIKEGTAIEGEAKTEDQKPDGEEEWDDCELEEGDMDS